MFDEGGSSGLLSNVWELTMNAPDQVHGMTIGYVADDTLQSLLTAALADNSPENMDAFHQYLKEQAYEYGKQVGEPKQTSGKQELYEQIISMYC